MTEMIRTASGDYIHPLDYVQWRRWRGPAPPTRHHDFTGAFAPGAEIPAPKAGRY